MCTTGEFFLVLFWDASFSLLPSPPQKKKLVVFGTKRRINKNTKMRMSGCWEWRVGVIVWVHPLPPFNFINEPYSDFRSIISDSDAQGSGFFFFFRKTRVQIFGKVAMGEACTPILWSTPILKEEIFHDFLSVLSRGDPISAFAVPHCGVYHRRLILQHRIPRTDWIVSARHREEMNERMNKWMKTNSRGRWVRLRVFFHPDLAHEGLIIIVYW